MRIALFIDTFNLGGAETMVFELASLLQEHGHEPVLLHFGSDYVTSFAAEKNIEIHLVPNHRLYKKTITLPLFAIKTIGFLKALKLDCLHSHLFGPIVAMAPAARMAGLRHVGTLHDVYTIEEAPHRIYQIKLATLFATHLIAVSSPMRRYYVEKGQFKPSQISHLPNFAPANNFLSERDATREALGLASDTVAIISVGRLVALKRFDLLIEACAKLKGSGHFHAFIAGDGPEREKLQKLIDGHELQDHVTLLGERRDVLKLLAAADVFVLASDTEGLSRSILEALASGLPVVATDVGGNCDLIEPAANGFLVPAGDAKQLSEKLAQVISNPALRETMASASKIKARTEFAADVFLQSHLRLYSGNP